LSRGSDSPKMTDNMDSSMPMRSLMMWRVICCQKDSVSSGSWVPDCGASWLLRWSAVNVLLAPVVILPSSATSIASDIIISPDRLNLLLLVSFSISSKSILLCSILHCSILCILSFSTCISCPPSTASNLLCTLDLLWWWASTLRRGLYCSNCHSCSCTGGLDAGNVPKPSCVGSIDPPLWSSRRKVVW